VSYFLSRPSEPVNTSLDFRQLDRLHKAVGNPGKASADDQKEVAKQFEALLIQQLLKQARQTGTGGLLDSDQTRLAQSLSDEQTALTLADKGIGLAQALLSQIQSGQRGQASAITGESKTPPELSSSRIPGLRSRIGDGRAFDASSISALIDMLASTPIARTSSAVMAAIQDAPSHIQSFVERMSGPARQAANQSGVPVQLILSQAALESGWGKHEIRGENGQTSYNLFGIKASPGWKGRVVNVLTTEFGEDGVARKVMQPFRAYGSYSESFADYARLISTNDRYSEVLGARTPQEAARRVQEAGYATDPNYAEKLISIMGYFRSLST